MTSGNWNIPKRFELIEDIAKQLDNPEFYRATLGCLVVVFYRDEEIVTQGSVGTMLRYLIDDMWQDGDAVDIKDIDRAEVRTL